MVLQRSVEEPRVTATVDCDCTNHVILAVLVNVEVFLDAFVMGQEL